MAELSRAARASGGPRHIHGLIMSHRLLQCHLSRAAPQCSATGGGSAHRMIVECHRALSIIFDGGAGKSLHVLRRAPHGYVSTDGYRRMLQARSRCNMDAGIESVPLSSLTLATFVDCCLQLTNVFLLCGAQVETPADPPRRLLIVRDDLAHTPAPLWRCMLGAHTVATVCLCVRASGRWPCEHEPAPACRRPVRPV